MRSETSKRIVTLVLIFLAFALVELVTITCLSTATHHLLVASLFEWDERIGWESSRTERTISVVGAPLLEVENLAGGVTVRAGQEGVVRLVAVERAASGRLLDRVEVEVFHRDGVIVIRSPRHLAVSVKLEITVPADTHLEVGTIIGNVDVRGLRGHVGVGNVLGGVLIDDVVGKVSVGSAVGPVIDVHRASGPVHLSAAIGDLYYQGTPVGDCTFTAGAGRIVLALPAELNAELDLMNGGGTIDVDWDVYRRSSTGGVVEMVDVIGSGDEATLTAVLGGGNITLLRR